MFAPKLAGFPGSILIVALLAAGLVARAQPGPSPLAEDKLIRLIELGIKPEVVVTTIQKQGVAFQADAAALERLKRANVPDLVLEAVRKAGDAKPAAPAAKPVAYQDIVELLGLGIPESEVVDRLRQSPTTFTLSKQQADALRKLGATDKLLGAMAAVRTSVDVASELNNLAIVFDCSGSMSEPTAEGRTKMEAARQAAVKLVQDIPDGVRLAFIIYGQDRAQACNATQVVRGLEPLDKPGKESLVALIQRLQPVGSTPIALALRVAGEELAKVKAPSGLVLISDGKEMCGGNPASEAVALTEKLKLDFGLQVVGFGVKPDEQQALGEIARAGHGTYYDAPTPAALRDVVQVLAKRIEVVAEPAAVLPRVAATPISAARPSALPSRPTPLKLGEVVKGRVDPGSRTNQAHYWLFDLPAGEYKVVVDMERSDRERSNIQGQVRWLDTDGKEHAEIGDINAVDYRARSLFTLKLEEPRKGMIQIQARVMSDYELGLFRPSDTLAIPFFRASPGITPIKLGEMVATPVLDPASVTTFCAYYSMTLPAGDFQVTTDCRRADGENSNILATLELLDADGVIKTEVGQVNEIDIRAVNKFRVAIGEEQLVIFRVTVLQPLKIGIKVEPMPAE